VYTEFMLDSVSCRGVMKQIPKTENALVLRTDFSNQASWEAICSEIQKTVGIFHFRANVDFLDDQEYTDITKDQLLTLIPANYDHSFIILVDRTAISQPDHPLLIVDLYESSGNEFRAVPTQVQGIENNLSIANMDFDEFADAVDEDGIFRGFPMG
jgi:uncharacterized protein YbcV (DUF1398 family)